MIEEVAEFIDTYDFNSLLAKLVRDNKKQNEHELGKKLCRSGSEHMTPRYIIFP